ncbi:MULTISPECIES: hypothetical protein [unclassified Halorubrum]|uniref:hypothetical protein n=1 Tax=unclassified Halorubrum TaxID=2642239 RepID=UPI001F3AE57B|nr:MULTISPECIES: hypothetical protein [unclassified Halorubrum]
MVQTVEAKQVCCTASTVLFPELEFGVKPCGKYTREKFREILSRIAFDQEFAKTSGKTLQLNGHEHVDITTRAPNSLVKSLLYHLRNFSADIITDQFDGVQDRVLEVLRSQRRLPAFVDVAIDLHEWRFYGSGDTDHICSVESDDSTVITIAEDAVISFFVVDELDRSTQRSRSVLSLARVHLYILSAAVLNRVQNDPILLPSVDSTKQTTS